MQSRKAAVLGGVLSLGTTQRGQEQWHPCREALRLERAVFGRLCAWGGRTDSWPTASCWARGRRGGCGKEQALCQ